MIWLLVLCCLASHIMKIFRFYIFLIDQKISFQKFVALYAFTSAVNLIIPFKAGELLRFAVIGRFLKDFKITLLAIITERFFDSIIVLFILLPSALKYQFTYSFMIFILSALVLVLFIAYAIVPSMVSHFNLYIMLKRNSQIDKVILQILDFMSTLHASEKKILNNKGQLIIFFTLFAWLFDIVAMNIVSLGMGKDIGIITTAKFIYAITSFNHENLFSVYFIVSMAVFAMIGLIASLMIIFTAKKR